MTVLPAYVFASASDSDGGRTHAALIERDARSVAWVARLRNGDEGALAEIIREYRAPLASFVARMLRRDADDADDLLQQLFFRFWKHRETLDPEISLRAYLFSAARNHVLNHMRDHARERGHVELDDNVAFIPSAAAELEARDLADAVGRAIDKLPARCREIFLLSRDGGLSYPEIAVSTGVTVNTVKTQMSRALTALMRAAAPFLATLLYIRHPL